MIPADYHRPSSTTPLNPNNSTRAAYPDLHNWDTPIPYLFGGLALMLGLIALALIMLACSFKTSSPASSSSTTHDDDDDDDDDIDSQEKPAKSPSIMEPRFLVIMAGNHNPTFIAMPSSTATATATAAAPPPPVRPVEEV